MKLLVEESVLRQALEALEHSRTYADVDSSIVALRAALATAEKAAPVAWTTMPDASEWTFISGSQDPNGKLEGTWYPLYAAPVGITDEHGKPMTYWGGAK